MNRSGRQVQAKERRLRGFSKKITFHEDGTTTTEIHNFNNDDGPTDLKSAFDSLQTDAFASPIS